MVREILSDAPGTPAVVARTLARGELVAINYTGSVYAVIFDCRNPSALQKAQKLKNRFRRSFTIHSDMSFLPAVVDPRRLNPESRKILADHTRLKDFFGAKYIVRIPIDGAKAEQNRVPAQLLGVEDQDRDTMHIISMETGENEGIQWAALAALKPLYGGLPPLMGMTSFNNTGEGSQNDPIFSRKLAQEREIPLLVHPPRYIEGLSYDIVSFTDPCSWSIFRSADPEKSRERLEKILAAGGLGN